MMMMMLMLMLKFRSLMYPPFRINELSLLNTSNSIILKSIDFYHHQQQEQPPPPLLLLLLLLQKTL